MDNFVFIISVCSVVPIIPKPVGLRHITLSEEGATGLERILNDPTIPKYDGTEIKELSAEEFLKIRRETETCCA